MSNLYLVNSENAPVNGLRVEHVEDTGETADPLMSMLFGLSGEAREYRVVDEIPQEIQDEFDSLVESGAIVDPQADVRRVFLFDSEVEPLGAAA